MSTPPTNPPHAVSGHSPSASPTRNRHFPPPRRASILPLPIAESASAAASTLLSFSRSYARSVEATFWDTEAAIAGPLLRRTEEEDEDVDVEAGVEGGEEEEEEEEDEEEDVAIDDEIDAIFGPGSTIADPSLLPPRRASTMAPARATTSSSSSNSGPLTRRRTDSIPSSGSGSYYPAGPLSTLGGPPPRRGSILAGAGSPPVNGSGWAGGSRRRSSAAMPRRRDSRAQSHSRSPVRLAGSAAVGDTRAANETTPLLGTHVEEEVSLEGSKVLGEAEDEEVVAHGGHGHGGGMGMDKSTFAQTCANAINILLGIGILSLPYAFRLTSVAVGVTECLLLSCVANFTARVLIRCMSESVSTYADLGHISFGPRGRIFISLLFIIELLTASVALVILAADSVQALFPDWDLVQIKAGVGVLVAMTTVGRGTRWLSYGSLVGVFSVLLLITIVLLSGLSTSSPPGSLLSPHPTVRWLVPADRPGGPWFDVPLSVGLVMAGYSGHATFPNIYRDMIDPTQYPSVVTVTFTVVTILSTILGLAGYIMFGATSMQEITQNLPTVPSFNPAMTRTTVVLIALNPLTKYALTLNPVNISLELLLFPTLPPASSLRAFLRLLLRLSTSLLAVTIAMVFPGFHRVMGLLGSLFSFTVSVVFPCACFLALSGGGGYYGKGGGYEVSAKWWERALCWVLVVGGVVMAGLGTVWSLVY